MFDIDIVTVGGEKEKYFSDACREYEKRLSAFCNIKNIAVKPEKLSDSPSDAEICAALAKEGRGVLSSLPERRLPVALCIEGKQYSSQEFAKLIGDAANDGYSGISFIIGSSMGLSDEVKEKCRVRFSMSKMTFPHRLARVMLLEQIYRAFTINANMKYHK